MSSPSISFEMYSKMRHETNAIVADIGTTLIQIDTIRGVETDLHLMTRSGEGHCADMIMSQPSYPWIEIALRIAQPRGECLFDRQTRKSVYLRSSVPPNGEAPLFPCDARDRRSTVAVVS